MNTLKKLTPICLSAIISLTGCTEVKDMTIKEGYFRGYEAKVIEERGTTTINIYDKKGWDIALQGIDKNSDGRFDEIYLLTKKGNPLERYANVDSLQAAYKILIKQ